MLWGEDLWNPAQPEVVIRKQIITDEMPDCRGELYGITLWTFAQQKP